MTGDAWVVRRGAMILVLALVGCAKPPPPPEVSLAESLDRLDEKVRETIHDEQRARAVLAVTSQLYELAVASAAREKTWSSKLREANRDYDTTPDELESLMTSWRTERQEAVERLIALRMQLATLLTADEWERLAKHRVASVQAYLEVGRAARSKRAVEGATP